MSSDSDPVHNRIHGCDPQRMANAQLMAARGRSEEEEESGREGKEGTGDHTQ